MLLSFKSTFFQSALSACEGFLVSACKGADSKLLQPGKKQVVRVVPYLFSPYVTFHQRSQSTRAVLVQRSTREVAALTAGTQESSQQRPLGSAGNAMCGYATQGKVVVIVFSLDLNIHVTNSLIHLIIFDLNLHVTATLLHLIIFFLLLAYYKQSL